MSSFYDLASLVMIPSGKKAGKVYSQKPLSTDGQLDFTRASTATRIGSDGLIEKTRTNLIPYSQSNFASQWVTNDSSIVRVDNTTETTSPIGDNTASKIVFSSANSYLGVTGLGLSGLYSGYIYVKGTAGETIRYNIAGAESNYTLTGGWDKLEKNHIIASATFATNINTFAGVTARTLYVWGSQIEQSVIGTDYISTNGSAVSVGSVDNMPRLNYTPGSATSCPSLLLEPQRTNIITQSEYFSGSDWFDNDVTRSQNTNETLTPAGDYSGLKITETATTARHRIASNTLTIPSDGVYTWSVFMKKGTSRHGFLSNGDSTIVVDLENGIITDTEIRSGTSDSTIENYRNGWYRLTLNYNKTVVTTNYLIQFGTANSGTPTYNNYIPEHAGNTNNYLYTYGAQIELGSYATSYIPTFGATVTRVADTNCNLTNFLSKGIISTALSWTVFFDLEGLSTNNNILNTQFIAGNGTLDVYVRPENENSLFARFYWRKDSKYIGSSFGKKIVARLNSGTGTTFADGVLNGSSSISGDYSVLGILRNTSSAGKINKILVFPTALTDAQCIELTTIES